MAFKDCEFGDPFAPRELEIIALMVEAKPDKVIAAKLGITPNTVKTYNFRIFKKAGVHSRCEFIVGWYKRAIAELEAK